jgi:pimeloyl-ACP methyl ester carboxylesterase
MFAPLLSPTTSPQAADRFLNSDGVKIRHVEKGHGDVVVLIHGLGKDVQRNWAQTGMLDALARHHRVVALDCRGHGASDKPRQVEAYGTKMVEDVRRLLDHLKIERAHLVGYSLGARIALKFAADHRGRVASLSLIAGGGARVGADHSIWDKLAESLERGEGLRPLLRALWPTLPDDRLAAINDESLAGNDPRALACLARSVKELATTQEQIQAIEAPVLAVAGSGDAPALASVEALRKARPATTTLTVDGADHLSILDKPALITAVQTFLSKPATRPANSTERTSRG